MSEPVIDEVVMFEVRHPQTKGSFDLRATLKGWRYVCKDCGISQTRPMMGWALIKGINHIVLHCKYKGRLTRD